MAVGTLSSPIDRRRAFAETIRMQHHEIEQRWLREIRCGHDDADLTKLRNAIPQYLRLLADSLEAGIDASREARLARGRADWVNLAREHAVTRVQLGFDISELVREFILLRQTISAVACELGVVSPGEEVAPLVDLIEAAIVVSVQTYVEARNFELRREQAEHIGFATHELRNPLSTAMAATAVLHKTIPALPELRTAVDLLESSHEKIRALVDGILLVEQIAAEAVQPHPTPMTVGELIEEATAAAKRTAQEKGIGFTVSYDPTTQLDVDRQLTVSALQNLVDNAAKYTDQGNVRLSVEDRAADIVVHVRDTCAGISEAELKVIFEPFRRGSHRKPGSGLGLAITRRALEAQGGSVFAESPGDGGCHFWFELPKRRQ